MTSAIDPSRFSREIPHVFTGPAGRLQGLWRPVEGRSARAVSVVAHPHPAYGGTMLNKVVFHLARVLNHDLDAETLRFNFRGIGESEGSYDEGRGERGDVLAAWEEARRLAPGLPLIAAGFSFGAAMTLFQAADGSAPDALALVGLPFRLFDPPDPFPWSVPLAAAHGEQDQYTPPELVQRYLDRWPGPVDFHVVPEADHFLEGRLPESLRPLAAALQDAV